MRVHSAELAALLIGVGGFLGGRLSSRTEVQVRIATPIENEYTDGRTIVHANPFGFYIHNNDDTAITCTTKEHDVHLNPHSGWWLAKGSELYQCVTESEEEFVKNKRKKRSAVIP